ncbi:hypothetical protein SAMN02746098_00585 [Desulfosporosinus lacus DSM 15449]|uniref:Uncharacterized protein n=1 Tax=Desulfosporosinus lacus DSM 15449 TaxID=1121420 RepID=A0A1M5RKC0_9FIRM|nr:hypothetical protein SAMN02746098_00585 [Desulfosporosinus lacus DSM 15449]
MQSLEVHIVMRYALRAFCIIKKLQSNVKKHLKLLVNMLKYLTRGFLTKYDII